MKRILLNTLCSLFFFTHLSSTLAQENERSGRLSDFANETKTWLEGYSVCTGGNNFVYHSLRNDLTDCMITRCTDGNMAVEWETSSVDKGFSSEGAGFVWIAAIDITTEKHQFDVFVDGVKRFSIFSGTEEKWEVKSSDGGILKYVAAEKDQHGDAHGYMALWAPKSWLSPGKPLKIKIAGNLENSSCWIIIYKAADALNYLHNSLKYNSWADLVLTPEKNRYKLELTVPSSLSGKKLKLFTGGKEYQPALNQSGNTCTASQYVDKKQLENFPVKLIDEYAEIFDFSSVKETGKSSKLIANALLDCELDKRPDGSIHLKGIRTYKPKMTASLINLSESNLSDGRILLMNSSHQDIAWMDAPEKCVIERDTMLITPLYNRAILDPSYRFDIEDALMLKEYITRHPDRKEGIKQLLKNGQISCGSTFIQPYEEMYSGEALIRQFYFGARWLKKELDYTANTYWNLDVPGKTLQMPQILKKSGTDFIMISRFEKGIYKWYSPDGSFVTTYSPGHYADAFTALQRNFFDAAEYIANDAMRWDKYYAMKSKSSVVPLLSDWDMSPAKNYSSLITQWNNIKNIQKADGKYYPISLPKVELSLCPDFIENFAKNASNIPSIMGERPAVWLYIHGPTHQMAIKASREGDILLTVAEKFAAIDALTDNTFNNYPEDQLNRAWEAKIYPDHGWGGKHGETTDALFNEKYLFARSEAEKVVNHSLSNIASKIKTDQGKGTPIVVFNSLSWKRTDMAIFEIRFEESKAFGFSIIDASGKLISSQIGKMIRYNNGSIKSAVVNFMVNDIPSIGYETYYLKTSDTPVKQIQTEFKNTFENEHYSINFANGGLSSIFDKQMKVEIIDNKQFNAGEVFTLHSEGTGAGEFSDIQQPDMKEFDKASNYKANWKIAESGEIFTSFINRQPIKNAVIEQKIVVYHKIRRIDFLVDLLNYEGVLYREYRMAMPLKMENGQVSYEVPFGVVNVGKDEIKGAAGERYTTPCKDTHPRGIENWIGADNSLYGLTMSSSVAVADYIDPTGKQPDQVILQPVLVSSRRSCHGEGNEYLQTGNHHFEFSLTTHKPGWENGFRFGRQANEKLMVVVDPKPFQRANLAEELSFFGLEADNLMISTIKKAEDNDNIVIRLFNFNDKETLTELKSFKSFGAASHSNLIEESENTLPLKNGTIIVNVGKFSIETYILR